MLPENWTAVQLFQDCSDQWLISPSGKILGLRNEAVDIEIKRGGYEPLNKADWKRLKLFIRVVVKEINR